MFAIPPEIILGPPGTGKTTELLSMVDAEIAAGTEPEKIGYVSFTRRAAKEATERACTRFSLPRSRFPWFRTLHSLCLSRLGVSTQQILDGDKLADFSDYIGETITGRWSAEEGFAAGQARGDRLLHMDNISRVRMLPLREQYDRDCDDIEWVIAERFSRGLREFKQDRDLLDYTDLLSEFVRAGAPPKLDVLFVDEGQDLSRLQWEVVKVLSQFCRRLVIAGDDDQSIYKWSGADPDFLIDMDGTVRVLGQSWRVPPKIQVLANTVISRVSHRRAKDWKARVGEEGSLLWLNSVEDVDLTGPSTMILARNRYIIQQVEKDLWSSGIFFSRGGHPSVSQTILDAIVAWERLRAGQPQTALECRRAYDLLASGSGVKRGFKKLVGVADDAMLTMSDLVHSWGLQRTDIWHEAMEKIPTPERAYMIRCRRRGERFSIAPRVRVDTIHSSKGGEADRVVLVTDMASRTFAEMQQDADSEARVFYVGITRAKRELCVVMPRTRMHYQL